MIIRELKSDEMQEALDLVLEVFLQFEAQDYDEQGIETFKRISIMNKEYISALEMYGAFVDERLVGIIATRNGGNHIAFFFVKGKYHRQGIGKSLFEAVREKSTAGIITVNSSLYAQEVYHHLGFSDTGKEESFEGVRFVPMKYQLSSR